MTQRALKNLTLWEWLREVFASLRMPDSEVDLATDWWSGRQHADPKDVLNTERAKEHLRFVKKIRESSKEKTAKPS